MDVLSEIKNALDIEIDALIKTRDLLGESAVEAVKMIDGCQGKIVVCGMGKPGHIARKISASMCSMGIPSYVLHPAEAQHGDLGMLEEGDLLLAISNSGETEEICKLIPNLKLMNIKIIAITSYEDSTLAKLSDCKILTGKIIEASNLGLAPTSSTTVEMAIGDALAVVVSKMRRFEEKDFALFHPAGTLGKKLLISVEDLLDSEMEYPCAIMGTTLKELLAIMSATEMGAVLIVDKEKYLKGIITDGDIKRYFSGHTDTDIKVESIMTKNPIVINRKDLAITALQKMEDRKKKVHCLAVVDDEGFAIGIIRNHDIIGAGIFL